MHTTLSHSNRQNYGNKMHRVLIVNTLKASRSERIRTAQYLTFLMFCFVLFFYSAIQNDEYCIAFYVIHFSIYLHMLEPKTRTLIKFRAVVKSFCFDLKCLMKNIQSFSCNPTWLYYKIWKWFFPILLTNNVREMHNNNNNNIHFAHGKTI